jgi:ABC-type multidrug transport system ATPase subunit
MRLDVKISQTAQSPMNKSQCMKQPPFATPVTLQVEDLCFSYPQRVVLTHLSVGIPPGVTLVHGGDGSGKSTLLRLLAGELPAQTGTLQVNDIRLGDSAVAYRQQVFWADPRSETWDQTTPLNYFKSLHRLYPRFDEQLVDELTAGLSLTPHLNKPLYMLSTGSKRKVWLAAAFASGAAVTLLDEPFAALDKASIGFVLELLADAAEHPTRAWVIADYEAPGKVPLAALIELEQS